MDRFQVVPYSVGVASRSWDAQQQDVEAASRQIDRSDTSGFTDAVAGVAEGFTDAWTRFAADLGAECESRADGLRSAIKGYVESDEASFVDLLTLERFVRDVR